MKGVQQVKNLKGKMTLAMGDSFRISLHASVDVSKRVEWELGVMIISGGVIVNIINMTGSRIIYPLCLSIMESLAWVKKAHSKYEWYHSVGGDMRLTKKEKAGWAQRSSLSAS